jgi:hypothetical protein
VHRRLAECLGEIALRADRGDLGEIGLERRGGQPEATGSLLGLAAAPSITALVRVSDRSRRMPKPPQLALSAGISVRAIHAPLM